MLILDYMTITISVISLIASIFVFWFTIFRKGHLGIVPENQIQLMQGQVDGIKGKQNISAFNILYTFYSTGASTMWKIIKFESAKITFPDNKKYKFICNQYLKEEGMGQQARSRNIPIAIKGGDSQSITAAFQSADVGSWIEGKYSMETTLRVENIKKIIPAFNFELNKQDLIVISHPNATYLKTI